MADDNVGELVAVRVALAEQAVHRREAQLVERHGAVHTTDRLMHNEYTERLSSDFISRSYSVLARGARKTHDLRRVGDLAFRSAEQPVRARVGGGGGGGSGGSGAGGVFGGRVASGVVEQRREACALLRVEAQVAVAAADEQHLAVVGQHNPAHEARVEAQVALLADLHAITDWRSLTQLRVRGVLYRIWPNHYEFENRLQTSQQETAQQDGENSEVEREVHNLAILFDKQRDRRLNSRRENASSRRMPSLC